MNSILIFILILYFYYETKIHQGKAVVSAQEPGPANPQAVDPENPLRSDPGNVNVPEEGNKNDENHNLNVPDKNSKDVFTAQTIKEHTVKRRKTLNTRATDRVSYHTITVLNSTESPDHIKEVKEKMCYLRPQPGPCRAKLRMYYFRPRTMRCEKFNWGGCQGNGNRFDTRAECRKTCVKYSNDIMPRPHYCTLAYDYGYCFGSTKRFYYDRITELCKEVIYSGCGGNDNNFISKAECEEECMLSYPSNPRKVAQQFITS